MLCSGSVDLASGEHLAKLGEGVDAWNQWRDDNPKLKPDFSMATLRRADLTQVDLSDADLRRADLSDTKLGGAKLSGADLRYANLSDAKLSGADVVGAELIGADLTRADLSHADLHSAELDEANFRGAKLSHADLSGTYLSRANFIEALLIGADLRGANLTQAELRHADLRHVDLSGADLNEADLSHADLSGANLNRVKLRGAEFGLAALAGTVFGATDLSTTKGLDGCLHRGPCVIDYQTLQSSKSLPLVFQRGCGLPDHYIEYLPSLVNQPIQYYSCFISYSSKDEEFTQRLHADLQNKGVRCWYAPEDMKIGDKIRARIDEVIRLHEKLLLVLSDQSINSDWVEKEIETAFEKERQTKEIVLFPIRLDDSVMHCDTGWAADIKRSRHIGDFQGWKDHDDYKRAFNRLLRDLKAGDQ